MELKSPFFFFLAACGILVPWPGVDPALEAWGLNYQTTREVLKVLLRESPPKSRTPPPEMALEKSIWLPVCDFLVTFNRCRHTWYGQQLFHSPFNIRIHPKPLDLAPTQCFMSQEELSNSPECTIHPHIWYLLSTSYAVGFAFRPRAQKWTRHSYCPKISSQFYRRSAKKSIFWYVTLWSHVTGCFENRKGPLTLWGLTGCQRSFAGEVTFGLGFGSARS